MWEFLGDLIWWREILRIKTYYNLCLIRLNRPKKRAVIPWLPELYISRADDLNGRKLDIHGRVGAPEKGRKGTMAGLSQDQHQEPCNHTRLHVDAHLSILQSQELGFGPRSLMAHVEIWYLLAIALINILISLCLSFSSCQNNDNTT